jgi:chemotaxis protein methyltransferase CheR/two-component system CheB/CheR fusion protein
MTLVAGIGASAGGLEAMLPLFAGMQPTGRIRYVVAQHMAKDGHDELVVRLIARASSLPVVLATHGVRMLADTVYVIPSGQDGVVQGNALNLCAPAPESISTPSVNVLLQSIANSAKSKAIGIVLSGTGSDGAAGCRAIRAAGGLTLAQAPDEAKFNGMPQAAIETNSIDQVLAVQRIGDTLATLFPGKPAANWKPGAATAPATPTAVAASDPPLPQPARVDAMVPDPAQQELRVLLRQVLEATGIDFSSYKEDTLLRRLDKRKALQGATSAEAYQAFIKRNPAELPALQHLFLVSVSSFFRDGESFAVLQRTLVDMLAHKPLGQAVRVWVPGCASGEEVYTLALILRELLAVQNKARDVLITGSDLNPEALQIARNGLYSAKAFKEMSAALRDRYFVPRGADFEVSPELRAGVRFERRDVLTGAPGADLDLVSCRNLLIYMKSPLQDQLIKSFHQALSPKGLLFIGQSESLSFIGNSLFSPIDHYHRLFRRRH